MDLEMLHNVKCLNWNSSESQIIEIIGIERNTGCDKDFLENFVSAFLINLWNV